MTNSPATPADPRIAALPAPIQAQLAAYRDLLLRWNRRFNLTAIEEPAEVDRRLIGDALRMLPDLDAVVGTISGTPRLLDIGTGAGFPGMVLKISRPDMNVTLMEATGKKVTFLQEVIRELGLTGIVALHGRAEEFAHQIDYRNQFDIVTARAVSVLPALLELGMPFLHRGGTALFPKGAEIAEELAMATKAASMVGARLLSSEPLPQADGDGVTRLVKATKIGPTPDRYPRRAGIPAREPLGR